MNSKEITTKPIAVVISDIHFNLNTLEIASKALKAALNKAAELNVPTIIAGDLQDTKAIIRGEVANRLISLLKQAKTPVYILVGNHDLINEKGKANALEYLAPYATIVSDALILYDFTLIPYQSDSEVLKHLLTKCDMNNILIMHQGFLGAAMGDYIQDRSSISPDVVKDFAVISGHYHRHQIIGTVTYIGSPYTITFGEANDGPKGFLILNSDGSFTREILHLRTHIKLELTLQELADWDKGWYNQDDLLWLKITGPLSELKKLDKKDIGKRFMGHNNFKLDLIPEESSIDSEIKEVPKNLTDLEILDQLIDDEAETDNQKTTLKQLYKELL